MALSSPSNPSFWDRFAIRRNDPRFWTLAEWFVETECQRGRRYEGLLDLRKMRIR